MAAESQSKKPQKLSEFSVDVWRCLW